MLFQPIERFVTDDRRPGHQSIVGHAVLIRVKHRAVAIRRMLRIVADHQPASITKAGCIDATSCRRFVIQQHDRPLVIINHVAGRVHRRIVFDELSLRRVSDPRY